MRCWVRRLAVLVLLGVALAGVFGEEKARSGRWPSARAEHLRQEGWCAVCGTTEDLDVHHIRPVHLAPELETVQTNLMTLCRHCHLEAGHLGHWTNSFDDIRAVVGETGARLHQLRVGARSHKNALDFTNYLK